MPEVSGSGPTWKSQVRNEMTVKDLRFPSREVIYYITHVLIYIIIYTHDGTILDNGISSG